MKGARAAFQCLVERLAELNETGRVGLAVSRSVKKPTGILGTTLENATRDASLVLPDAHPPEALSAMLHPPGLPRWRAGIPLTGSNPARHEHHR